MGQLLPNQRWGALRHIALDADRWFAVPARGLGQGTFFAACNYYAYLASKSNWSRCNLVWKQAAGRRMPDLTQVAFLLVLRAAPHLDRLLVQGVSHGFGQGNVDGSRAS